MPVNETVDLNLQGLQEENARKQAVNDYASANTGKICGVSGVTLVILSIVLVFVTMIGTGISAFNNRKPRIGPADPQFAEAFLTFQNAPKDNPFDLGLDGIYKDCIEKNVRVKTSEGTWWISPIEDFPDGIQTPIIRQKTNDSPVVLCYLTCSKLENCAIFTYNGWIENSCKFGSSTALSTSSTEKADERDGNLFYNSECMVEADKGTITDLENPSKADYAVVPPEAFGDFDYTQALGLMYEFFEGLWAGKLPPAYRIDRWRKEAFVDACGRDGGSFMDGTAKQSTMITSQTVAYLSLGLEWYEASYDATEYNSIANADWAIRQIVRDADWLSNAFKASDSTLLIGSGTEPAAAGEAVVADSNYARNDDIEAPALGSSACAVASREEPASEVVASTAAALALASRFSPGANVFVANAEQLLSLALESNVTSDGNTEIGSRLPSPALIGAAQHRFWAACALLQATTEDGKKADYYDIATEQRDLANERLFFPVSSYSNPVWMGQLCMAQSALNSADRINSTASVYSNFLQPWIEALPGSGIARTPEGLTYAVISSDAEEAPVGLEKGQELGLFRDAANAAFIALVYADLATAVPATVNPARCFAKQQVDYILGKNPQDFSYVVGFGTDFPATVDVRDSVCPFLNDANTKNKTLCNFDYYTDIATAPIAPVRGALVSSMDLATEEYVNNRTLSMTKIGQDFNAGLTGALAGLAHLPATFFTDSPC